MADRQLIRAYGLRPDLFAVANVIGDEAQRSTRAYAKGALEAIGELCHLQNDRLAVVRTQVDELAEPGSPGARGRPIAAARPNADRYACRIPRVALISSTLA
jgi:hypothetical protein